ncbi:regulatory protein suaprga1 [Mycena alexandri]|uniref:Regulatory protein suaprga1 n=1 Tax=Mycena alexandri TaxID=1745969 RepID=A0AAD6S5N2_9AGAR|nr:regulatory protein suaprga1 [Mycena alexandri]KAJ7032446.1 regulatory protein suaprga1 [Mycena alexandri]
MSALRAVRQLTAASARLTVRKNLARGLPLSALRPTVTRAFGASARSLKAADSPASQQLAQKLREELKYEEQTTSDEIPQFLADFKESGVWEIQDTPANDEVFLTRTFGEEKIRIMFSIADLHNIDPEEDEPSENANAQVDEPSPEFRILLSIAKPNHPGALNAYLYCAEDQVHPVTMGFYKSARIAQELSIEADFLRRTVYVGPPIEMLDLNVQELFTSFLRERSIDEELAAFVPLYAKWKEQREYVEWLRGIESFVAA